MAAGPDRPESAPRGAQDPLHFGAPLAPRPSAGDPVPDIRTNSGCNVVLQREFPKSCSSACRYCRAHLLCPLPGLLLHLGAGAGAMMDLRATTAMSQHRQQDEARLPEEAA